MSGWNDSRVTPLALGVLHQPGGGTAVLADTNALSAYLRYRLELLKMTPTQLADETGISRATIYRLLGGRAPEMVSSDHLKRLAETLEVDARDLAALWHGLVQTVEYDVDERDEVARGFVMSTRHLTVDELRAALEVAKQAAELARRREGE